MKRALFSWLVIAAFLVCHQATAQAATPSARRMGDGRPARSTVFVAGFPGGAVIKMDLIARARK